MKEFKFRFRVWSYRLTAYLPVHATGLSFLYEDEYMGQAGWQEVGYFMNLKDFDVEPFTGLKDGRGQSIYENDYLDFTDSMGSGQIYLVTFQNGQFTNGNGVPIWDMITEHEGDDNQNTIGIVNGNFHEEQFIKNQLKQ